MPWVLFIRKHPLITCPLVRRNPGRVIWVCAQGFKANDVMAGCAQLLAAIEGHDAQADVYRASQRALLARYLPGHADVTAQYSALLEQLFQ